MACACRTRIVLPFVIIGSLLGLAIAIFGGGIVNAIVKLSLPVTEDPSSKTFDNWKKVPLPIYNYFYLFNITNVEELLQGSPLPVVNEVGPFVFREERQKINYTFLSDGSVVEYNQTRTFHFVPELSLPLDTQIYHLNVPLISAAEFARTHGDDFYFYVVNELAVNTNSSLYPTHTARELLFEGYDDPILTEGQGLIDIPYDKFGWFYGKNDTSTDGIYEMYTGTTDLSRLGRLLSWNDKSELPFKGACQSMADVSAGDLHPPFPDLVSDNIKLFVGEICRPLTLKSHGSVIHKGVKTQRFATDESTFDYSLKENQCYCMGEQDSCPKSGVANVSACVFNTPAAISLPHFLHANPIYTDRVKGLKPEKEMHTFYMDLVTELGAPVAINAVMQINIVLTRDQRLNFTRLARDDETYYPIFYFITNATLSDDMAYQLSLLQKLAVPAIEGTGITILVICSICFFFITCRYSRHKIWGAKSDEQLIPSH